MEHLFWTKDNIIRLVDIACATGSIDQIAGLKATFYAQIENEIDPKLDHFFWQEMIASLDAELDHRSN